LISEGINFLIIYVCSLSNPGKVVNIIDKKIKFTPLPHCWTIISTSCFENATVFASERHLVAAGLKSNISLGTVVGDWLQDKHIRTYPLSPLFTGGTNNSAHKPIHVPPFT
jgi:hypothetical protein